jgi:hypothetical protein
MTMAERLGWVVIHGNKQVDWHRQSAQRLLPRTQAGSESIFMTCYN